MDSATVSFTLKPYSDELPVIGQLAPCDFYDCQGRLNVAKGQVITADMLEHLTVHSTFTIQGQWNGLTEILRDTGLISESRLEEASASINSVLRELHRNKAASVYLKFLRRHEDYTYSHSLNVALLAHIMGAEAGMDQRSLHNLTMGAILHDVGKVLIPRDILHKDGPLTDEEYSVIKMHPLNGISILDDADLVPDVMVVVRQHHELWNGSGYPLGLQKHAIHPHAQLVAVADVFDAMTSNRPYRKGMPPYYVVDHIMSSAGSRFSRFAVDTFLKSTTLYPEDCLVTLSTGETGRVLSYTCQNPTRPVVQLLYDSQGAPLTNHKTVDLTGLPGCLISRIKYRAAV